MIECIDDSEHHKDRDTNPKSGFSLHCESKRCKKGAKTIICRRFCRVKSPILSCSLIFLSSDIKRLFAAILTRVIFYLSFLHDDSFCSSSCRDYCTAATMIVAGGRRRMQQLLMQEEEGGRNNYSCTAQALPCIYCTSIGIICQNREAIYSLTIEYACLCSLYLICL